MTGRLFSAVVVLALLAVVSPHADSRALNVTPIAREGQVLVSFELSDGITPEVKDAIQSGLPTTFSYQIDVSRGTSGWFDRTLASVTVAATVRFDNLTRRYQLSRTVDGRVGDTKPTEDQEMMRRWMTRFEQVPVVATAALENNGEYAVRVRAQARPHNTLFLWPWDRGTISGDAKFTFIP